MAGQPIITGSIDDVDESYASTNHDLSARGRDAAGDLVDCSAIYKSGEWKNTKLENIATDLCKPFGISVTASSTTGKPFESFRIQEGETVFECLERACRQRAVLMQSDGSGGLVIGTAAENENSDGALKVGKNGNVLKLSTAASARERFSQYIVKGSNSGGGFMAAEDIAGDEGKVQDGTVKRYRPLIILAEEPGDGPTFKERAQWEQRVRASRAKRITATVQGWLDQAGKPWRPGDLVPCEFPRFKGQMLITTVRHTLNENGTLTSIELSLPGAFDVLAEPDASEDLGW